MLQITTVYIATAPSGRSSDRSPIDPPDRFSSDPSDRFSSDPKDRSPIDPSDRSPIDPSDRSPIDPPDRFSDRSSISDRSSVVIERKVH